jgi:hypothetical protein
MNNLIKKQLNIAEVKGLTEETYTLTAVISSGLKDRYNEIVDQTSWNLDEYKKNPVVLWGHDHTQPAIGKALDIYINENGMLEAIVQFAVEEYEFAKTIFKLYAGGFMKAFSVGFTSGKQDMLNDSTILRDNTLYEFSAVNVGADALALAKQKGIDVSYFDKINKSETIIEKKGRVLSAKNRETIEKAKQALEEVLVADKEKNIKETSVVKMKYSYKKVLSKAVRELIKARNEQ